jgi:plastocyanin
LLAAALAILPLDPVICAADSSALNPPVPARAAGPADFPAPVTIVKMSDDDPMYQPDSIVILAGQTVEWRNGGTVSHSVTDDSARADKPDDAARPLGATPFNSGSVMPGGSFRHTFDQPGKYRYFCLSHESDNMIGEITVQPRPPSQGPGDRSQPWRKIGQLSSSDR